MMVINHEVLLYHDHRDDEIVDDDHDFHGDDGREYEYESPISIRDPSHDEGCGMTKKCLNPKTTIRLLEAWSKFINGQQSCWITPVARPGRKQRPKLT